MSHSYSGHIIGVVGWKDAGKTPVVERLVALLTSRGFTVGTVKHVHEGAALQPEAADSARHLKAGAACTVVLGDDLTLAMTSGDGDLEQAIARHLVLCDYIVVEGFKQADIPKIAVIPDGGAMPPDLDSVVAVVCNAEPPGSYPGFTFDEIEQLGEFLFEKRVLRPPARRTSLLVNGKSVPLNEFVQSSLAGVIRGFVASLKDVDPPTTIHLTLKGDRPLFPS